MKRSDPIGWATHGERASGKVRPRGRAAVDPESGTLTRKTKLRFERSARRRSGPIKAGQGVKDVNRRNALASSSADRRPRPRRAAESRDSPANDRR